MERLPTVHQAKKLVHPTEHHTNGILDRCAAVGVLEQTARAVLKKVDPRTEPRMSYTHDR